VGTRRGPNRVSAEAGAPRRALRFREEQRDPTHRHDNERDVHRTAAHRFDRLSARLRQNSVQEKLTAKWIAAVRSRA
jgi:hypothetical protein